MTLDLKAVEALLGPEYDDAPLVRRKALEETLAALRATRAALQEFVMRFQAAENTGRYARGDIPGIYVDRGRFERAATVLASVSDAEERDT